MLRGRQLIVNLESLARRCFFFFFWSGFYLAHTSLTSMNASMIRGLVIKHPFSFENIEDTIAMQRLAMPNQA